MKLLVVVIALMTFACAEASDKTRRRSRADACVNAAIASVCQPQSDAVTPPQKAPEPAKAVVQATQDASSSCSTGSCGVSSTSSPSRSFFRRNR